MNNIALAVRAAGTALLTWLSMKFGLLLPAMGVLIMVMLFDYYTGWNAAIITGTPITSAKGHKGFLKKTLYIVGVFCGLIVDWLILTVADIAGLNTPFAPIFGIMMAVYLIINELVSILENMTRAGVSVPPFLMKVVQTLKIKVEQKGDSATHPPTEAALEDRYDREGE